MAFFYIMTTSLVIEPVSPALASGSDDPWTSASFTPPNNSILLVGVAADWFGGTPTFTVTSAGLTFNPLTKQGAINQGAAQFFTAEVGLSGGSARTVAVTTSLAGAQPGAVKVWVISGQHASYLNVETGGTGITTNDFDATITTTADGCQVFGMGAEWQNLGAATSYDIYENATPGGVAPIAVRKSSETVDAGVETINFNASTLTSTPMWTWAAVAIRPATYTKPAIYKRPLRARVQNLTSQTSTVVPLTTASTIQVGSYLVASLALDNAGTNGAAVALTVTDPRSNTWTVLAAVNNDPGAASAGVTGYIAYCKVANAYSNGDSVTFNYGGVSTPAKAIVIEEYAGIHSTSPVAVGQVSATGLTTTPSVSITPTAADQLVVGSIAIEGIDSDTYTADADTTNGIWNKQAAIGTTSGTAVSNMLVRTVSKLVSASGAQTWNPTITARDWSQAVVVFAPAPTGSTPITGSESTAISVADGSSITAGATASDTASLSVSDVATIQKNFTATDTAAISVADTSAHALASAGTESVAISVSDTGSLVIVTAVVGSESTALSVSDVAAITVAVSGTESTAISVSDQATLTKTNTVTDTTAIGVDDQATLLKTIPVTDSMSLAVSDVASVVGSAVLSGSESTAISVSDVATIFKTVSASDTIAISVDDQGNKFTDNLGSDNAAISVSDIADVQIFGTVTKAASDTAALSVSTTVSGSNSTSGNDSIALSVSESVSTAVAVGPTDSIALAVTETVSLLKQIAVTDTAALTVTENVTQLLKSVLVSASDTMALAVSDSGVKSDFAISVKVYSGGVWVSGVLHVYIGSWTTPTIHQRRGGAWS